MRTVVRRGLTASLTWASSITIAALMTAIGCGAPPPAQEPAPTAAPTPQPTDTAEPVATAPSTVAPDRPKPSEYDHECGQDHGKEAPVVSGSLGEGKRIVRVINNGTVEVQARLLNAKLEPAVPGTLRVLPGKRGEFNVDEGEYFLRYRLKSTCEVRRGSRIKLTGPRRGLEHSIRPGLEHGSSSHMKVVDEAL